MKKDEALMFAAELAVNASDNPEAELPEYLKQVKENIKMF
jgi:hypothetical protein